MSEQQSEENPPTVSSSPRLSLTSDEVNYLIFRYLQESGFVHSAFSFAHESVLSRSGLRAVDRSLPPGALITFLQKGLQYIGIEETMLQQQQLQEDGSIVDSSELFDFSLLSPNTLTALSRPNPPIHLNLAPATAAAAIRARLEAEAKVQQHSTLALAQQQDAASLARQALAAQAAAQQIATLQQQNQLLVLGGAHLHKNSNHNLSRGTMLDTEQHATIAAAAAAQHQQRALDLLALQQQQSQLPPQPLADANLLVGAAVAAAALTNSMNNKRNATGSKRAPKKQKKNKGETAPSADEASSLLLLGRNASLGTSSEKSEPAEGDEETQERIASSSSVQEVVSSTPMDIDGDNGQPQQQRARLASKSAHHSNGDTEHQRHEIDDIPGDGNEADTHERPAELQSVATSVPIEPDEEDRATAAKSDEILLLQMHESEVFMCAWNPVFTSFIATGSGDASARIWEVSGVNAMAGLKSVKLLPHGTDSRDKKNKDVTTLEWSTNGEYLATGSYDGIARVWSRSGDLLYTLCKHTGPIFSLKWNRTGSYLLSGSYDTTAIVWDVSETNQDSVVQQFTDHDAPALDVDWKDHDTFATCSTDKTVHIHKVGVTEPLKVYRGHNDEVNAVKWDPSGMYLASCSDDCTAKVWEVDSPRTEPLYDFTSHQQEIYTVKWSPTGPGSMNPEKKPLLATASFDGTVRLWNISDGSCFAVFNRHRDSVYTVAFSPSGDFLSSGSLAGQMYIWEIATGQPVKSYKGRGDIFEVAWNKEETRVAACFSSNVVALIDFDRSSLES